MVLAVIITVWGACQAGYWCTAGGLTLRHLRKKKRPGEKSGPRAVVLKPLCGHEKGAFEHFSSFCRQEYADYVLAFGVADAGDAAVRVVRRLQRDFPGRAIQLHIGEREGLNPKVRILRNLAEKVEGEVLLVSDADVQVQADYVGRMVGALADPQVGLVICPYAIRERHMVTDRLESMRLAGEFVPSAIFAHTFGAAVGLGAAMAFRRSDLEQLGGFATVADYLLEDHRLALEIKRAGRRVEMLPEVVELDAPENRFGTCWRREMRWARGIRTTGVWRYAGVGLLHVLPVVVLAALSESAWAWGVVGGLLLVRIAVVVGAGRAQGVRMSGAEVALFPLRDAMSFLIWAGSLVGGRIEWRGRRYFLRRDGRLALRRPAGPLLRLFDRNVRWVDRRLRLRQGIFEFTSDPNCVLRLRRAAAQRAVVLSNGTQIRAGDTVGELHLWNEHIPQMTEGASVAWSLQARRMLVASLQELTRATGSDPRLRGIQAFYGCAAFVHRAGDPAMERMCRRLGFEMLQPDGHRKWMRRVHDFFENALIWALSWTFNRGSLAGKSFLRPRQEVWMSLGTLLEKYQTSGEPVMGKAGGR